MGIKHLRQIELLFKSSKTKLFSKTSVRDLLQIDLSAVEDALSFLVSHRIIKKRGGKITKYQYAGK